jgi:hypothetical protein
VNRPVHSATPKQRIVRIDYCVHFEFRDVAVKYLDFSFMDCLRKFHLYKTSVAGV